VEFVLASFNRDKLRELAALLDLPGVTLTALGDVPGASAPPEDGTTLLENALIKARAALALTGRPALADDTGLEVDALGGEPGVRSSRYAGENVTYADNNRLLLERLRGIHGVNRRARFRCVLVLTDASGKEVTAEGKVEGFILDAPRGEAGFGYDPLFLPEGGERTLAELTATEKNSLSHRARAAETLLASLHKLGRWVP